MSPAEDLPEHVRLRPVERGDIPTLFAIQADPEGNRMAKVHPRDRATFDAVWEGVFADPRVVGRAIVARRGDEPERIVGSISCFQRDGVDYVGYWIDRPFWGRGYASRGLALLLQEVERRPLLARVAADNAASLRVLTRCGFTEVSRGWSPGDARLVACDEVLLRLDAQALAPGA